MYCTIGGKTDTYKGPLDVLTDQIWRRWDVDLAALGANLSNIPQITIGIKTESGGTTGGKGTIFLDDIQLTGFAPTVPAPDIVIEAEDYTTISAPMEVNNVTAGASGGKYIEPLPGTSNSTSGPPDPGVATYDVDLSAGQYIIYGRVSITGGYGGDAFYVFVDGATSNQTLPSNGWATWNGITAGANWHWVAIWHSTGYFGGNIITWTVPEDSTVTINIAYRDTSGPPKIDVLKIVKVGD